MESPEEISRLLIAARQGHRDALDRLMPLVYEELHSMAHRQLNRRRPSQTLNTTALVHEAYLKLVRFAGIDFQDRSHFLAVAAVAMRQIVVNYARDRVAQKRGGHLLRIEFDKAGLSVDSRAIEIVALDQALTSLSELDERSGQLVELRFFGGLTNAETAAVLAISERTVKRDWRKSRAYLYRVLGDSDSG